MEGERPPLRRRRDRALLGGVCAGIGEHLDLEVVYVRAAFALLATLGGVGIAVYALGWALLPPAPEAGAAPGERLRRILSREGVAVVLFAVLGSWLLHRFGFGFGGQLAWPLVLAAAGLALVWRQGEEWAPGELRHPLHGVRERIRSGHGADGPRTLLGVVLVVAAAYSLLRSTGTLDAVGRAFGGIVVLAAAVALIFGPWLGRLARTLGAERAERIRSQERAEVAAHLHDSVLQTLALIQKRAEDPREVAQLARQQERELRSWLTDRPARPAGDGLVAALEAAAEEIEQLHRVPIEVVAVGDCPLDEPLAALVQAAREALANAAKFAGAAKVDLYAEVGEERVEVFVRDRGVGFDLDVIPADRRGVRESILGRMERHGGRAAIRAAAGGGTEVELTLERAEPRGLRPWVPSDELAQGARSSSGRVAP